MPIDPRELVKGVAKLVSLPEVCVRVNEMVDDPRYSAGDIGKILARDTALTAQLLRLANSSFFNFPSRIETVSRAITVIGERELRYLVLALSAVRVFAGIPVEVVNMSSFWRHSVYTAVVSRLLAKRCHVLHNERLFVAGLLHDIGQLLIFNRIPELARVALLRASDGHETLQQAEQEVMGCDHAQVGAELLELWHLPPVLCATVRYHHAVDQAGEVMLDAAIVHLANYIANRAERSFDEAERPIVDPLVWEITSLDETVVDDIVEEAGVMFAESWAMIQPLVHRA